MSLLTQSVDVPAFARTQLALLDAELQSEIQETSALVGGTSPSYLQRAGLAVTNLVVASQRTGLGGRTVVELAPDSATSGELPEHGVRVGDIVLVSEQPAGSAKKREVKDLEKKGARGVVIKIKRDAIAFAVDEDKEDAAATFGGRVWLVKLADDVTYRRMNQAMERMRDMGESEYSGFMRVLFGLSSPSPVPLDLTKDPEYGEGKVEWFDPTLNDSQKDAVRFALASKEIALIHGPPGVSIAHEFGNDNNERLTGSYRQARRTR